MTVDEYMATELAALKFVRANSLQQIKHPVEYILQHRWYGMEYQKEMKQWCSQNLLGQVSISHQTTFFEKKEDAAIFRLRWC